MLIRKKRIRTIDANIRGVQRGDKIVVALRDPERFREKLLISGFSGALEVGETILPTAIGTITRFNAEGKYDVHKDQPKETAYRLGVWKWMEFRGRHRQIERSKIVEIPYKRYPRTFIPPPSVEISIAQTGTGEKALVCAPHDFVKEKDKELVHTINLFLEIFGECELLREDLSPVRAIRTIRLNWEILPPGKMPWARLQNHLSPIIARQPEGNRVVVDKRHEAISAYSPDFVAIGRGGFNDYVVFGFSSKNLFILESTQINNATYVVDRDWETLSTMTKAELLQHQLHKERIVHREKWFSELHRIMTA